MLYWRRRLGGRRIVWRSSDQVQSIFVRRRSFGFELFTDVLKAFPQSNGLIRGSLG